MFDLGDVINDGSSNALDSDSMIYIEWDAILLDTAANNTEYWVSAGAEYNGQNDIWVGQASFLSIIDDYSHVSFAFYTRNYSYCPSCYSCSCSSLFRFLCFLFLLMFFLLRHLKHKFAISFFFQN